MEHRLGELGEVYREGDVQRLSRFATTLTAFGAALIAARGKRSRPAAVVGGVLLSAGAIAERWTVFRAGTRSAERPQDTVEPQRARRASRAG